MAHVGLMARLNAGCVGRLRGYCDLGRSLNPPGRCWNILYIRQCKLRFCDLQIAALRLAAVRELLGGRILVFRSVKLCLLSNQRVQRLNGLNGAN